MEATMREDNFKNEFEVCENCGKTISSDDSERDSWIPYYFDENNGLEHGSLCAECTKLLGVIIDPEKTENYKPKQA
jgi:uncharacterized protein with PIN domain